MLGTDREKRRVLVVDDEADIRALIGSILDATALPHDDVVDGSEALEKLSGAEYDAVILDIMLPGIDGLAVLGTVHAARPDLLSRIIVLTGGPDELVARVDQPVFRIMRKPFSPRDLVEALNECLKREPSPAAEATAPSPEQDSRGRAHIRLAQQGGFIVDFPGFERWWVEADVEPFRSEGRGLKEALHEVSEGGARDASRSGISAWIPMERTAESIRDMLLELERLGLAVRV